MRSNRFRPQALFILLAVTPTMVGAWLLLMPPMLSQEMTWDLLFNLSGAWHLYLGHVAHVDFHEPVGELNFALTVLGFQLLGFTPKAFLVGEVIASFAIFTSASLVACCRLPMIAAAIFITFATLLILVPVNIGDPLNAYSFAMAYNRYGWSALCVMCLAVFLPPRFEVNSIADAGVFLGLLMALFYIKVTYFAAGLAALGTAILVCEHVQRRWWLWSLVGALAVLNAAAPYSRPYLTDVFNAAQAGGVRSGVGFHLNRFLSHASEYAPYVFATVFAIWLWVTQRAPKRLPVAVAFLTVIGFSMLSQNAQSHGMPIAIVVAFLLYAQLLEMKPRPAALSPLLIALLIFPVFEVVASALSLTGYWVKASQVKAQNIVPGTRLKGLAVPEDSHGLLDRLAAGKAGYELLNQVRAVQPRFELSQAEYVETLIEAAQFLETADAPRVVILDQVNPLPFMLGGSPVRYGNLWSGLGAPQRPPEEMFAEATHVLIPKFSTYGLWTSKAVEKYGTWLERSFSDRTEIKSWIVLSRAVSEPKVPATLSTSASSQ